MDGGCGRITGGAGEGSVVHLYAMEKWPTLRRDSSAVERCALSQALHGHPVTWPVLLAALGCDIGVVESLFASPRDRLVGNSS